MPVGVVKTAHDEELWTKAKAQAEKEGKKGNWAYVMGIFKKMKGESVSQFVDRFLAEDDVEEMTTTGMIATVPMGPKSGVKRSEMTPKNPPDSDSSEPDRVGKVTS